MLAWFTVAHLYLCGSVGVSMGFFIFQLLCTLHEQFCKCSCMCEYLCISASLNSCVLSHVGCEIGLCLDVFVCTEGSYAYDCIVSVSC